MHDAKGYLAGDHQSRLGLVPEGLQGLLAHLTGKDFIAVGRGCRLEACVGQRQTRPQTRPQTPRLGHFFLVAFCLLLCLPVWCTRRPRIASARACPFQYNLHGLHQGRVKLSWPGVLTTATSRLNGNEKKASYVAVICSFAGLGPPSAIVPRTRTRAPREEICQNVMDIYQHSRRAS